MEKDQREDQDGSENLFQREVFRRKGERRLSGKESGGGGEGPL